MTETSPRPRRSVLYMPGSNARALEKARTLPADCLILDMEDAVAPDAKETARTQIAAALAAGGFGPREVMVRINGLDTPWGEADLAAAAAAAPDAIVIPKVSDPDLLVRVGRHLAARGTPASTRVWAMMETARGVLAAREIADAAREEATRLAGFILGTNDLAKETRACLVPGRAPMMPWLMTCVAAARAAGIDVVDGVYNALGDDEGFRRECVEARDMGFDGKTLIHPNQIAPCNAIFSPAADEVAWARKIIAAFNTPEAVGKGVIQVEGRMVELLHAEMARRLVAIAEAIAAKESAN